MVRKCTDGRWRSTRFLAADRRRRSPADVRSLAICFLVASPPVQNLLLRAKYLFGAASRVRSAIGLGPGAAVAGPQRRGQWGRLALEPWNAIGGCRSEERRVGKECRARGGP